MDKIVKFYPANAAKNPDNVLEQAIGNYNDVLVIGWDKDDYLDVRTSLGLTHENVLFLVEKFKHKLLNGDYSESD